MKKLFKNWNLFEILFLACSLTIITICFFAGEDRFFLSFIASIFGIITVICTAKGLIFAQYINLVYNVLYATLSIMQRYFGEAIICIVVMIPINIFSIISWIKNRNKENSSVVEVNHIHGKEYAYLALATIFATFGFYFLLKVLDTNQLIISTISLVSSLVASYLMLRRCKFYALFFILNDIILITLWSIVVATSGIAFLPTLVSFCVFFINDIYGFIHWSITEKRQRKNNLNE